MPVPTPKRGAIPSPRSHLAAATPHKALLGAPPSFIIIPAQLSGWGNIVNGDCVTAEEAFAKACNNPEIFIPEADAIAWATKNGILNGASISGVLQLMQNGGFVENGAAYNDGPYQSVDWTNEAILQSAIWVGPVKLGVAGDQLDAVWQAAQGKSGWFATGFKADSAEDHCPSLCGFGTISWLAQQLQVSVPAGIDGTKPGYALFTWDSIGIIDVPSLLAITQEAWVRNPTTVVTRPFSSKVTLHETSAAEPALAAANGMVYLAWKGNGNDNLNVACSSNGGASFGVTYTSPETSPAGPALCAHNGLLSIAWTGNGNNELNVATVGFSGTTATGFSNKVTIAQTSPFTPALASLNGLLFIAWKGEGNDNLNVMCSSNNGATFVGKYTSPETSPQAPTLAVFGGNLYIAWKGDGNNNLNLAQVQISGTSVTGFVNKVTLAETSQAGPALTADGSKIYLGWSGVGNNNLNVSSSTNAGASFGSKLESTETSSLSPALTTANGIVYIAWTGSGNLQLNVASVANVNATPTVVVQKLVEELVLSSQT